MRVTSSIVEQLDDLLGPNFLSDPKDLSLYYQNVTEFYAPRLIGVAKPTTVSEVSKVLQIASEGGIPVYTITTGMNWGLGSKVTQVEGCLLLTLENLRTIRYVNEERQYAVIEAGVTQAQLYSYLQQHHPGLVLPVTGSSPNSAIISNCLERGTSFHSHRAQELKNLEVILSNGSLYRTGFWDTPDGYADEEVLHYSYGTGPDVAGLFVQSNLGVVSAGVLELRAKPEAMAMVLATFTHSQLDNFINAAKDLYRSSVVTRIFHIGNDKRMKIKHGGMLQEETWTAMTGIEGSPKMLQARIEELKDSLSDICKELKFVNRENLVDGDVTTLQLLDLHQGIPATIFIEAMYVSENQNTFPDGYNVDKGTIGMLCCLPIVPVDGPKIRQVIDWVDEIATEFQIQLATTVNPLNDRFAEFVINIYFNRLNSEETQNAHNCNRAIHDILRERGIKFYRLDVEEQKRGHEKTTLSPLIERLKDSLDPAGILSPGKYGIGRL